MKDFREFIKNTLREALNESSIMLENHYLKRKGLLKENYSVQNFITDFHDAEFFEPFLQAVGTNSVGLNINKPEDWNKIITMDRKELQDTFGLTIGTAMKLYKALQSKIGASNQNTVDGRAARLKDFFKTPGTSGDYAEFKAMNNHFMEGGEIDNLEPKLKKIYMSKYDPFTKEEFMEIFKKVNMKDLREFREFIKNTLREALNESSFLYEGLEIEEKFPIKVFAENKPKGDIGFIVRVPPMTMTYDTWEGLAINTPSSPYSDNTVKGYLYNEKNGEASYETWSFKNLQDWARKNSDKIIVDISKVKMY